MGVSYAVSAAREARRNAFYADRTWAREGAFSARLDGFGPYGPCVCGICGFGSLDDQTLYPEAKAHHLQSEHRAVVTLTSSPRGEAMYAWSLA